MAKQIIISREKFLNAAPWLTSFADDRLTTQGNVIFDADELRNQVPASVLEKILNHDKPQPVAAAQPPPPKSVEPPPQVEEKVADFDSDKIHREALNASIQRHEAEKLMDRYFQIGLSRSPENKSIIFKWFRDNSAKPSVENVQKMIGELGHAGSDTLTWTRPQPVAVPVAAPPAPPPPAPEILEPLENGEPRLLSTATNEELHRASNAQLKDFIARNKPKVREPSLASWQLKIDADPKTIQRADPRAIRDLVQRRARLGIYT